MNHTAYIPSGLLIYTVVSGLLTSARSSKAKLSGATEVFDASPLLKAFMIFVTVGFAGGSFFMLFIPPPSRLGSGLFAFFSLCGVIGFPNPIILTPEKIEEVKWWGRLTSIKWADVAKVEFHKGPTTTVVIAKDGRRIAHSGFHAATEQFRENCARLSHHSILIKEF
jgi:hypothetical protein